jgi:hypothetical protein
MSAPQGPTGLTGAVGLQGFRGPRGTPLGPTGPSYRSTGTLLNIEMPSTSTITLTESNIYTFYSIQSETTSTVIFPTRSETYPTPEKAGVFWVFGNSRLEPITLNFSNGTVSTRGNAAATTLSIPIGNSITIAYDSNITGYIAI